MADDRNKNDTTCRPTSGIILRPYQEAALVALWDYWREGGGNPLIEAATGTGKSIILAEIIRRLMVAVPRRILVVTHVRELISQDIKALKSLWSDTPCGICCTGLGQHNVDAPIVFASIQSIHKNPEALGQRNI